MTIFSNPHPKECHFNSIKNKKQKKKKKKNYKKDKKKKKKKKKKEIFPPKNTQGNEVNTVW